MEIVHNTQPEHLIFQPLLRSGQMPSPSRQGGHPGSESRIQTFDVRRVDLTHPALCFGNELLDAVFTTMHNAPLDFNDPDAISTLDDLGDVKVRPDLVFRPTDLSGLHFRNEAFTDGADIGYKTVYGNQNRLNTIASSLPDHINQAADQSGVSTLGHHTPQKQAGFDDHGRGHPNFSALSGHTQLIGLNLLQLNIAIANGLLLNRLPMLSGFEEPIHDRPLIHEKSGNYGLYRAAIRHQCQNHGNEPDRVLKIEQGRALGLGESLPATVANKAPLAVRVDTNAFSTATV